MNQMSRSQSGTVPTEVGPVEARALLAAGAALVDVREPHEWSAGHAEEAFHIPLGQLVQSLHEVPRDRPVVVVCRSGTRSASATRVLRGAGFDAINLQGGMAAWRATGLSVVDERGAAGVVA